MKGTVADPKLRLFFDKLLKIKIQLSFHAEASNDAFLKEICQDFEKILKEAKE